MKKVLFYSELSPLCSVRLKLQFYLTHEKHTPVHIEQPYERERERENNREKSQGVTKS